jgi:hypothetical protein
MNSNDLPAIRSGERADYKRCKKKWFWAWRMGLVPRAARFGALELGTWVHAALADWYRNTMKGRNRSSLSELFWSHAQGDIYSALDRGAPEHIIDKALELQKLGEAMTSAYQQHYADDTRLTVVAVEIPLEFTIPDEHGRLAAVHKFKPDAVFLDQQRDAWLMEHKTASSIRTEHLVLDDQARPYGAMAERALKKLGVLDKGTTFKGIMYNFLRKALPDSRPTNAEGKYLNQNGDVSKSQPPPLFVRKPITLTAKQRLITLRRVQAETLEITREALRLRRHPKYGERLQKTPHRSCPKTCDFFAMCVAEEEGTDITSMQEMMFIRRDPYLYEEENPSADEHVGFEMG